MTMGKPGVWDEDAFQKALLRFEEPMRSEIEAQLREDKELLLSLATK